MKKLLVLALTVIMVLSMVAVAMAAATVTVGGEIKAKINANEGVKDAPEMKDNLEAKITATGKFNDQVSGFLAIKSGAAKGNSVLDESYISIAQSFGTFKVGYFGFKTKGKVDVIDATLKDLKADAAVLFSAPFAEGLTANVWYGFDYAGAGIYDVQTGDGAYAVGVDYASDTMGGSAYIINVGGSTSDDAAVATITDLSKTTESAYTANFWIIPVDGLTAYLHYGSNQRKVTAPAKKNAVTILGAVYVTGPISARFEYDVTDHKDETGRTESLNPWGIKLNYKAANGLQWELVKKDSFYQTKVSPTTELSVKVSF